MRSVISIVVAFSLGLLLAAPAWAASPAPTGTAPAAQHAELATPEQAIAAYLAGVAALDLEAVLAASVADEMSQKFDFVAFVDRLGALVPTSPAPATDRLFVDINRATYTAQIARQVLFLAYGLMTTEEIIVLKTVPMDAERAARFAASIDARRLAGLRLEKVAVPLPKLLNSERNQANWARQAATYGADEATERVALLSFEGKSFLLGFGLLRYGDTWRVNTQYSALAGTAVVGTPVPTTPEDFEKWDD